MNVAFLGATRGMGRELARLLAARGDSLCLLGRNTSELERSAKDLELRGAPSVSTAPCDLLEPETLAPALDTARERLGGLDLVVVTAGMYAAHADLERDAELRDRLLRANFANTIQLCQEAADRLVAGGGGTLCVFSSVAGDRARKTIYLYGATKAGLSYYLEGLDHRFHGEGLRVVCVKPGFVKTGMTANLDPPPFAGEPEPVARRVLRAIDRGKPVVYAPPVWWAIMAVIRSLPRLAMRRLDF